MESITTSDFYEASYYLLNQCSVQTIQCIPINGRTACKFTFEGDNLGPLQITYFQGRAEVNLLQFRRAYGQVNSYAYEAKKRWKQEQRQEAGNGGEV